LRWRRDRDRPPFISAAEFRLTADYTAHLATLPEPELQREMLWPGDVPSALAGFRISPTRAAELDELRDMLASFREPNAVWMDTTTVYRAHRMLSPDPADGRDVFDPLALLDLDSFVRNVVLYDQIVYAAHDGGWTDLRPVNERLREPLFVTMFGDDGVPEATCKLFDRIHMFGRKWLADGVSDRCEDEQLLRWRDATETVFGVVPDERAMWRIVIGWGSDPDYVTDLVLAADGGDFADPMWGRTEALQQQLIGDATTRQVFNQILSRALGLPYHPAASRMPTAISYSTGRAIAAANALHAAMQRLHDDRLTSLRRFGMTVEAAPVWAAVLLSRVATSADLLPALIELREQTAPLRAARAKLDRALADDRLEPQDVVDEAMRELRAKRQSTWKLWAGTTSPIAIGEVAEALTGAGTLGYVVGVLGVLGASLLSSSPDQLRARLLRPHHVILSDLGSSVRHLQDSLPKAQQVWKLPESTVDQQSDGLARMARLGWA
jgi:hypothetical protein